MNHGVTGDNRMIVGHDPDAEPLLTVVNFSGGKQSSCLLWMVLRGEVDWDGDVIVLNADPGMENSRTYRYVAMMKEKCEEAGIYFETVEGPNLYEDLTGLSESGKTRVDNPAYWTKNEDGKEGKLMQKCTKHYKIAPMNRALRRILDERFGISRRSSRIPPGAVQKWIGFSASEVSRIKPPGAKYVNFRYPLIEMGMTNDDVLLWYRERGIPVPDRSVCNACVSGDTKVIVRGEGVVPAKDCKGRNVTIWSGKEWRDTTCVSQGVREMYRVSMSDGNVLDATGDQEVMTNKGWKEVGELAEGDKMTNSGPDFPPFEPGGDYDLGVLAGYVMGDGCLTEGEHDAVTIYSGKEDSDDIRRLAGVVSEWSGSKAKVRDAARGDSDLVATSNPKNLHVIQWRGGVADRLRELGFDPDKSCCPTRLWRTGRDTVAGFLSGLFSADGCVSYRKDRGYVRVEIILALTQKDILTEVQQLLFSFGIASRISKGCNGWRREQGYKDIHRLYIGHFPSVKRFLGEIGIYNARKRTLLERSISEVGCKRGHVRSPVVKSVVSVGEDEVFDFLNVGPEQQFIANGVVVHNCFANGLATLQRMHNERPEDWEQAVRVDEAVRDLSQVGIREEVYVNKSLRPLREIAEAGFEDSEDLEGYSCDSGYCFL